MRFRQGLAQAFIEAKVWASMSQGCDGPDTAKKIAQQEVQLTQAALTRNPKSYSSWHHRKWIIQMRLLPLDTELQLVKQSDSANLVYAV